MLLKEEFSFFFFIALLYPLSRWTIGYFIGFVAFLSVEIETNTNWTWVKQISLRNKFISHFFLIIRIKWILHVNRWLTSEFHSVKVLNVGISSIHILILAFGMCAHHTNQSFVCRKCDKSAECENHQFVHLSLSVCLFIYSYIYT